MTDGGPFLSQLLTGLNVNALYCDGSFFNAFDGSAFFPEPNGDGQFWFRNFQCGDTGHSLILHFAFKVTFSAMFWRHNQTLCIAAVVCARVPGQQEDVRLTRVTANAAL